MFSDRFRDAAGDLLWHLDRGYPKKASVQITGDRYRLVREERGVLYRGVTSSADAAARVAKQTSRLKWSGTGSLLVDLYNVALVIFNYRRGRPVFISTDGFVRDVGGVHGAVRQEELFLEVLRQLLSVVEELFLVRTDSDGFAVLSTEVCLYLDAPVSGSRRHAAFLSEISSELDGSVHTEVVQSADFAVLEAARGAEMRGTEAVVCSGDSHIIDRSPVPVFDLAAFALDRLFIARIPDLRLLLPPTR